MFFGVTPTPNNFFMNNKDPPEGFGSVLRSSNTPLRKHVLQNESERVLKWLDDAHRVFAKLEKLAVEAYVLPTLIYALIRIVAHH